MSESDAQREPSAQPHPDVDDRGAAQVPSGRWVVVRHITVWRPPTDVFELDDRLVVVVEIAGMREGDFSVLLQGKKLIIGGVRQRSTPPDASYHQLEIAYGEFRTEVTLPWQAERNDVSATYRDGYLRIVLPHVAPRAVPIVNLDNEPT